MERFSKETQKFLLEVGGDRSKILQPTPPSADRITPGDILIFRYNPHTVPFYRGRGGVFSSNQKVTLIVRCKRGDGVFPGKTGKLVSCFKLTGDSEAVVDAILENLYKKRRRSSYYGKIKESLIKLLGIDSFRTYKLTEMKQIYKVSLGNR